MKTTIDPYETRKPCPECKQEMTFEHNALALWWYCENNKCKNKLIKEKPVEYSFIGRVEMDWKNNERTLLQAAEAY